MKIIFLGGIFDNKNREKIEFNSIGVVQNAADALQKGFLRGLKFYFRDIIILNLPYIGPYPQKYKKNVINFEDTDFENIPLKNIKFLNLSIYRMFSRFVNLFKSLFINVNNEGQKILLIYAISIPFILASVLIKRLKHNTKIVLIVPDLPEYMNAKNGKLKKIVLTLQNRILLKLYKQIDGFVLLTSGMIDRMKIPIEKTCIIEGIYSDLEPKVINSYKENENSIKILYTGTLEKIYGIVDLLNEFCMIQDSNYELIICGTGDGEEEVIKFAEKDKRIKFLGQKTREEILILQRKVSILINPRKSAEFTKYSFPSKTMEYLASGTPAIMYKLEGIPEEYFKYCIVCDESIPNDMLNKILFLGKKPIQERNEIGKKAKQFILEEKNSRKQVYKLKKLIDRL